MNEKRYKWLRDHSCNSLSLTRNDEHAPNYTTATDWIENIRPEDFAGVSPYELQRMKDTNTIWRLQIYPDTPVCFVYWFGATLDAVIDRAMSDN